MALWWENELKQYKITVCFFVGGKCFLFVKEMIFFNFK